MEINVTEEDIDNGQHASASSCAVALAIGKNSNHKIFTFMNLVIGHHIMYNYTNDLRLPEVYEFAKQFDEYKAGRNLRPKPITFHLSAEVFIVAPETD